MKYLLVRLISLIICINIISIAAASSMRSKILDSVSSKTPKTLFKIWHYLFAKTYDLNSLEGLNRYKNFKANLAYITKRNSEQSRFKLGLGPFTDQTFEEFKKKYLTGNSQIKSKIVEQLKTKAKEINFDQLADEIDREDDDSKVAEYNDEDWSVLWPSVRNQGSCGSCWAYGTTGIIEAFMTKNFYNGTLDNFSFLSTQQLVDCDKSNGGCNGGWYESALGYCKKNPIVRESDYEYNANDNECTVDLSKAYAVVKKWKYCAEGDHDCSDKKLNKALAKGPYATAVDVNEDFMHYKEGVLETNCSADINHAVIVVQRTDEFVKMRNSWSEDWGEQGYIRIARNADNQLSCHSEGFAFWIEKMKSLDNK